MEDVIHIEIVKLGKRRGGVGTVDEPNLKNMKLKMN